MKGLCGSKSITMYENTNKNTSHTDKILPVLCYKSCLSCFCSKLRVLDCDKCKQFRSKRFVTANDLELATLG